MNSWASYWKPTCVLFLFNQVWRQGEQGDSRARRAITGRTRRRRRGSCRRCSSGRSNGGSNSRLRGACLTRGGLHGRARRCGSGRSWNKKIRLKINLHHDCISHPIFNLHNTQCYYIQYNYFKGKEWFFLLITALMKKLFVNLMNRYDFKKSNICLLIFCSENVIIWSQ